MSAVSSEWDLSIGPALAKLQELLAGVNDTMAQMASAVASKADEAFTPLGEASKSALKGLEGSSTAAQTNLHGVATSAQQAATAVNQAATAGGHAAGGLAQAGHGAQTAQTGLRGFAAQALNVFHVVGTVGHGISGMQTILNTARNAFNNSSPATQSYARNLMKITAVAGGTAAAIWGINSAWKAWSSAPMPKTPKMPSMGGGNGGFTTGLTATGGPVGNAAFIATNLFSNLGPMIAAGLATAGLAGIVGKSMSAGKEDELRRVKFEAIVGDTSKAKAALEQIRDIANITPGQTFGGLVDDVKKLVREGYGIEEIPNALRKVGDVAIGSENSVTGLAQKWLDLKAAGKASLDDLNGLTGQGIPIIEALAKTMAIPTSQVEALAAAGNITFPQLEAAWESMSAAGGRFIGAMYRVNSTTSGALERIGKEMSSVFSEFGKPINDMIGEKLMADVNWAQQLHEWSKKLGESFAQLANSAISAYQVMIDPDNAGLIGEAMSTAFKTAVNQLYAGLVGAAAAFGVVIGSVVETLVNTFGKLDFLKGLGGFLNGFQTRMNSIALDFAACILEAMKKIPGLSSYIGNTPLGLREMSKDFKALSDMQMSAGKSALAPFSEQFDKLKAGVTTGAADAFHQAANSAGKVFDVTDSEVGKQLEGAYKKRIEANKTAMDMANAPIVDDKGAAKTTAGAGPAAASGVGAFAQAVNFIFGRSVNELILSEAQKQTPVLQNMSKTLVNIEQKIGLKPSVDLTPRFY